MDKLPTYPLYKLPDGRVVYVSLTISDGGRETLEVCGEIVGGELREFTGSQEQVITLIENGKAKGVSKPWEFFERVNRRGGVTGL